MITTTMSDKGQVTLPATVRKKLGLGPRRRFEVVISGDDVVLRPIKSISDVAGIFHERAKQFTDDWETIRQKTERAIAEEVAREGLD